MPLTVSVTVRSSAETSSGRGGGGELEALLAAAWSASSASEIPWLDDRICVASRLTSWGRRPVDVRLASCRQRRRASVVSLAGFTDDCGVRGPVVREDLREDIGAIAGDRLLILAGQMRCASQEH